MAEDRQPETIPRDLLEKYFKDDPRLISALESQSLAVEAAFDTATGTVSATEALQNATVITLSTNAVFTNEFILSEGDGTTLDIAEGSVSIAVDSTVARTNGQSVQFIAPGNVSLGLPNQGVLVSDDAPAVLYAKTIDAPIMTGIIDVALDSDAAAAGVPLGGIYRDGTALKIRVV
jgi:hypothetical protein